MLTFKGLKCTATNRALPSLQCLGSGIRIRKNKKTVNLTKKVYLGLAEGPVKKICNQNLKKNFYLKKYFEKMSNFLAYKTPRSPLSVHQKFKPIRSSRLAGYKDHVYECLVLL